MALFVTNHSIEKIKILGRWKSDAFMNYIRPQVLEWTNNMSEDMVRIWNFTDLSNCTTPSTINLERMDFFHQSNHYHMAF